MVMDDSIFSFSAVSYREDEDEDGDGERERERLTAIYEACCSWKNNFNFLSASFPVFDSL